MAQQSMEPPPEKMVRQLVQADHTVGFYSEIVSRESTRFQQLSPIKRGTPYSETVGADQTVVDLFGANLRFLQEKTPLGGTEIRGMVQARYVIWHWGTDQDADNATNPNVEYLSENVSYPIYTRITTVRRSVYEANPTVATGTALTSLIGVTITAGGSGYTSATGTIAIGATVEFVISGGVLVDAIVTNEGTAVTSGGSITITGDGIGATATAIVQPATAVLISQKKIELSADDPYSNEYVKLQRIYRATTGPLLQGQDYDPQYDVVLPFTQQETPAGSHIGVNRIDIKPIDSVRQEERTVDPGIAAAVFGGYLLAIPSTVSLQLPDVLQSISAIMETNSGAGTYSETGSGFAFAPGGWSLNIPGRGQASAAILPDIAITIKQPWAHNIPSTRYIFFMQIPVTTTDVTNRLTALVGSTISTWPKFSPVAHTVLCVGQRLSLQVNTSAQEQDSLSGASGEGYSESSGHGYSKEVGVSIKAVRIPPCIHGSISISGTTSDTVDITATAASSTGSISASESQDGTVAGSITPTTFSATSNDSSIPTSGLRLVNVEGQPYKYGYAVMHAEVVDFANVG